MQNLAYRDDASEIRYECLNGKTFLMSPRPMIRHTRISSKIYRIFANYLDGKPCEAFPDGVDVYFDAKNQVIPDAMIVCNQDIVKEKNIQGAPDLIVEVLAPATAKRDRGYKKSLYERFGVKEYWIVNPVDQSIEVHLRKDGAFVLDNIYMIYPECELEDMRKENLEIITEFKTSLFDDMIVKIADVFEP